MAITINGSGITSSEIADGTIVNADINSSAAIAGSKLGAISGLKSIQKWNTNGSYTWTKPAGVTSIQVFVTGSGGGGGSQGYGGAAGGTAIKIIDVTSVSSVSVTVGEGGTAGGGTANGGSGNTSSFSSYCSATGGSGGTGGSGTSHNEAPAEAGLGTGGDINIRGNNGSQYRGGNGGSSYWGAVHSDSSYATGENTPGVGGGGNGGPAGIQGFPGSSGLVVVYEYGA